MSIIIFIIILSFLVIIHEIGHFVAAKWAKIKVEEFGLGYPPVALKLFRKWDTDFTLNWVPFGGFVKMEGEDGEATAGEISSTSSKKTKGEGPFYEKSAFERLVVILAGATVNIIFGVLAFAIVFSLLGIPTPLKEARIAEVAKGSPAEAAGLPKEVNIIAIRTATENFATPNPDEVVSVINHHRGQTVTMVTTGPCKELNCQELAQEFKLYVRTEAETPKDQGAIGILFQPVYFKFFPWYEMPFRGMWYGFQEAFYLIVITLNELKKMSVDLVSRGAVPQQISGPVGIIHQAHQSGIFQDGPLTILRFAGILSISLGIMNVLPIPALDGGRAVFILLEKVLGRQKISSIEGYANYGGFIFLVGMILLVTVRDISRIFIP